MELPKVFYRYRDDIVKELASNISGGKLAMYDMMRYHMGWTDEQGNLQDAGGKLGKTHVAPPCMRVRRRRLALGAARSSSGGTGT